MNEDLIELGLNRGASLLYLTDRILSLITDVPTEHDKLQSEGVVHSSADSSDKRVRTIGLTTGGEKLVASSKRRVWPRVESAVADACRGRAESLLSALGALEESLLETPLNMRAAEKNRARA